MWADADLVPLGEAASRPLCGDQPGVCHFSPLLTRYRVVDGDHRLFGELRPERRECYETGSPAARRRTATKVAAASAMTTAPYAYVVSLSP